MKRIITVLLLSFVSTAYALPDCPSELTVRWHNCFGSYTSVNGNEYGGEWKDDKQHGLGTHTWVSGERYVGEWKDAKRHGQGTYTSYDGDKYLSLIHI